MRSEIYKTPMKRYSNSMCASDDVKLAWKTVNRKFAGSFMQLQNFLSNIVMLLCIFLLSFEAISNESVTLTPKTCLSLRYPGVDKLCSC